MIASFMIDYRLCSAQYALNYYDVSTDISTTMNRLYFTLTSECETFGGEPELLAAVHSMQQAVC